MTAKVGRPLGPVQIALQLVQNVVICGMDGASYVADLSRIHEEMAAYAIGQLRSNGWEANIREGNPDFVLTVDYVTAEEREDSDIALAYWAETSAFFRKVFQAAAAAA
jgi:hypothetical protein